ncbi:MAG: S1C family serine protease, partial [Halobacteriales archaeon]
INNGNSGGPVYNGDGEVVGIATFKPADLELEEIAFALPIEIAKGFLGELGIENEPGRLTTTYEEGLNAYWRGDCETVTEKMESVLELWPDHPYAQDFIDDC